jgi:hypothetical protein
MRSLITLSFKARPKWRAFFCAGLTTQKRYDCSAAFPTEVLCTNSTSARLYFLNDILNGL